MTDIQIGDEIHYDGYDWEVGFIEGNDIRLDSDRLDDDQPYWIWLKTDEIMKELSSSCMR